MLFQKSYDVRLLEEHRAGRPAGPRPKDIPSVTNFLGPGLSFVNGR